MHACNYQLTAIYLVLQWTNEHKVNSSFIIGSPLKNFINWMLRLYNKNYDHCISIACTDQFLY